MRNYKRECYAIEMLYDQPWNLTFEPAIVRLHVCYPDFRSNGQIQTGVEVVRSFSTFFFSLLLAGALDTIGATVYFFFSCLVRDTHAFFSFRHAGGYSAHPAFFLLCRVFLYLRCMYSMLYAACRTSHLVFTIITPRLVNASPVIWFSLSSVFSSFHLSPPSDLSKSCDRTSTRKVICQLKVKLFCFEHPCNTFLDVCLVKPVNQSVLLPNQ